jgi:serine/threonine-protein kinase
MNICLNCGLETPESDGATCPTCKGPAVPLRMTGETLSGRVLGDKYVILKPIGRGGMGSVYYGRHRTLGKNVAIKVINSNIANNPAALRRFYAEAKNAGRLDHPNNVRVFDFGHEGDGVIYIVMEVVRGQPLSALPMPLSLRRVLRITSQVCGALAEAHSLGLVHRDLKPDNIIISEVDGLDFARVLDYGISKGDGTSAGITHSGVIVGTPEYLSPEQATGEKVDGRSDIYALGILIYQMVTGTLPFRAETVMGFAYAHKNETPKPPGTLAPLPVALKPSSCSAWPRIASNGRRAWRSSNGASRA